MSDEWSTLAEEIAGHAQNYVDDLARVAGGEGGDAIWSLLLVEVAQVSLAGAKLGANQDVILSGNYEPPLGEDPDIDGVRTALGELLEAVDDYAEVFDPYKDTSVTPYRLSDDLTAVAADLIHGLRHYQAGGRTRLCGGGNTPTSTPGATTRAPPCARCRPSPPTRGWTWRRRPPPPRHVHILVRTLVA